MPRVNIPNVGVVHFPDDMSEADIIAEVERLSAPEQPAPSESDIRRGQAEGQINLAKNFVKGLRERILGLEDLKPTNILGALPGMARETVAGPGRVLSALGNDEATGYREDPLKAIEDVAGLGGLAATPTRLARMVSAPMARRTYQSALKGDASNFPTRAAHEAAIEAGLKEGINPVTKGGADKLSDRLGGLNTELSGVIREAGEAGTTASTAPVLKAISEEIKRAASVPEKNPQAPGILRARAREVATGPTFSQNIEGRGRIPQTLSPEDMQTFKRGVQENAYEGGLTGPALKAEEALARGAKASLEAIDPRVGQLNAQMSPLIDLQKQVVGNLRREGNKDLLSPGRAVTGAVLAGGGPGSRIAGGILGQLQGRAAYPAAQGLYRFGQGPTGLTNPSMLAALAALLESQPEEPEP